MRKFIAVSFRREISFQAEISYESKGVPFDQIKVSERHTAEKTEMR